MGSSMGGGKKEARERRHDTLQTSRILVVFKKEISPIDIVRM
jgi:hypothetical protein